MYVRGRLLQLSGVSVLLSTSRPIHQQAAVAHRVARDAVAPVSSAQIPQPWWQEVKPTLRHAAGAALAARMSRTQFAFLVPEFLEPIDAMIFA